jgi:type I restriction enzyme S subunit
VNQVALSSLEIEIPTLPEQQKLAKILSTVDNLIEKTQTLIEKYTAIKQGMMADLFTRGIDMSTGDTPSSKGGKLRPSVEDAPELYKQTELGWVPKEWEIVELESIANVDRGKFTHRPRDDAKCYGGEHPFIQTGSVTKAKGGFITDYKQTLSEFGRNVSREFSAGTIAVTIAANIADTGILNIPMCFPDSIVGVNVDENKARIRFVEITIRRNKQRLDAIAPLSAQKNINLEDLRPLKLALPDLFEQVEICKRYEVAESLIHKETDYLSKLKEQKKGLMQDLLTGKVSVV